MKRPSLQNKRVAVLRMPIRARERSSRRLRNRPQSQLLKAEKHNLKWEVAHTWLVVIIAFLVAFYIVEKMRYNWTGGKAAEANVENERWKSFAHGVVEKYLSHSAARLFLRTQPITFFICCAVPAFMA